MIAERSRDLRTLALNILRRKKSEAVAQIKVAMDQVPPDAAKVAELKAQLQAIEEVIEEKANKTERTVSKIGSTFNERVREAMFKTSGEGGAEHYYDEEATDRSSANPNPFVRRKTIQHVMHVGEEAERLAREQQEEKRRLEEAEAEQRRLVAEREARRAADPIASDMHALKRKKTEVETLTDHGVTGAAKQLVAAHDFDLDLDI